MDNLHVITQFHKAPLHAGYSVLYDLETLFEELGIKCIQFNACKKKRLFVRSRTHLSLVEEQRTIRKEQTLLICCYTPSFLQELHNIPGFLSQYERVCVYFLDGFDAKTLDGLGPEVLNNVDTIFSFIEEVAHCLKRHRNDSHFVPLGINSFSCSPRNMHQKSIDVLGFGRTNEALHKHLSTKFNQADSLRTYVHDTADSPLLKNQSEHRRLYWKLLGMSKIALCFEASDVPRFQNTSPILYRWYEALAAGCVIAGTKPKCQAMSRLFNWKDSTIELPGSEIASVALLDEILSDTAKLQATSLANRAQCLARHDWRYRIRDILDLLEISYPDQLKYTLDLLSNSTAKPILKTGP